MMSGSGEDAQELGKERQAMQQCLHEGNITRALPIAVGVFGILEWRKQKGLNRRHFMLNGLIAGFVGIFIARISKAQECSRTVMERFPNGRISQMHKGAGKKGFPNLSPNVQKEDEWSGTDNDDSSGSIQNEENTNTSRRLSLKEARARYIAQKEQEGMQTKGESQEHPGFFTDTDSKPRSSTGKNKYGDSWDTSG